MLEEKLGSGPPSKPPPAEEPFTAPCRMCSMMADTLNPVLRAKYPGEELIKVETAIRPPTVPYDDWIPFCQFCIPGTTGWLQAKKARQGSQKVQIATPGDIARLIKN